MLALELFSDDVIEQQTQARDLRDLVLGEAEWLQQARPETLANYTTEAVAVASIQRVVEAQSIDAIVLRRGRIAIGIGTIASDLTIRRPGHRFQRLRGDEIDYWTVGDVTVDEHDYVATKLLELTNSPMGLAILTKEQEERARGIPRVMSRVGAPGRVRVPFGRPGYGLRREKKPLQTYAVRFEP